MKVPIYKVWWFYLLIIIVISIIGSLVFKDSIDVTSFQSTPPKEDKAVTVESIKKEIKGMNHYQQQIIYKQNFFKVSANYIKLNTQKKLTKEEYESILLLLDYLKNQVDEEENSMYIRLYDAIKSDNLPDTRLYYQVLAITDPYGDTDFPELENEFVVNSDQNEQQNIPTISKQEFNEISNYMTYDQVCEIIGGSGELISEVGDPGSKFHTKMYSFIGEGRNGANANFTFQAGRLVAKAEFGLE
ncbi:hypothetical protein [Paenibacillus sp. Y412MC10]|uniref:hypothetical protein n=1 Tax=Geobacillus sp. (strain Y412MC10) TaxID=481743 RepID=UPI0021B15FB9|nr:hypothetical protein [Paenibacillus sp. Y412MC10]